MSVAAGRHAYPTTTVTITAKDDIPGGVLADLLAQCLLGRWTDMGDERMQALVDHDSVTIDGEHRSGTLSVDIAKCYGQTDLYKGSKRYDGVDGALPHYPDSVTPQGLIAYSNGGQACASEQPVRAAERAADTVAVRGTLRAALRAALRAVETRDTQRAALRATFGAAV